MDEEPSFGRIERQIDLVFFSSSAPPVVPFGKFPEHIDMFAGLAVYAVVLIGAKPVDEIAFGDLVLLWKYMRSEFAELDPLADGTAVITGEVHNETDVG